MKIGDRVRIVKCVDGVDSEYHYGGERYIGMVGKITDVFDNGDYELDIDDGEWMWEEEELELVQEFDNDTYCDLICKYSDVSRELGKQKRDCELISKEIDRLRYEKESIEEEMHSMMKEFGERCERIGNE